MTQFAIADDGCRLAYRFERAGDAPVLMLSNSLGTDMQMWDPQIEMLSKRFRVLRYDTRGHGRSDAPGGAYSLDRLGRDAIGLLDHLEIERAHFCGLSLGGMTAQWLSYRASERIDRLVIANSSAFMGPPSNWQSRIESVLADGMAPLASASTARWFTTAFAQEHPEAVEPIIRMLKATDPRGYAGCCAAIRDMDLRPVAHLNRVPTLVIAGAQDEATPVSASRFIAERAAHARLVEVDGAHLSNVEAASAFGEKLIEFLAG